MRRSRRLAARISGGICMLSALTSAPCTAADAGGVYVGAVLGYADVGLQGEGFPGRFASSGGFDGHDFGISALLGIRPWTPIGTELSFIRFGNPSKSFPGEETPRVGPSETLYGVAADGVFYLPVPKVDVFVKAGLAELFGTLHSPQQNAPTTNFDDLHISQLDFATGIGIQMRLSEETSGGWTARAQYDRFVGHGNTGLAGVGVTYSF